MEPLEGGKYGQMTCFYCLAEGNTGWSDSSGFRVNGDNNSLTLIGCKSLNNYGFGYRASDATNLITMYDCSAYGNGYAEKGGAGTFTIKNTTLVE